MPKAISRTRQRREKKKQAQQAIGAMIDVMSGSAECVLKEPVGLVLTSNSKSVEPITEPHS